MTTSTPSPDVVSVATALGVLPESWWTNEDDACDCTFQRIGMWTNPYLAETLEVRMCCIWKALYEMFPDHVRTTPAYLDQNAGEWVTEPREWDGEYDMPTAIWHRQEARRTGRTVAEMRRELQMRDEGRPRGIPRAAPVGDPDPPFEHVLLEMVMGLAEEVAALRKRMDACD